MKTFALLSDASTVVRIHVSDETDPRAATPMQIMVWLGVAIDVSEGIEVPPLGAVWDWNSRTFSEEES